MKQLTYLLFFVLAYFLYTNVIRKYMYLTKVKSSKGTSYLVRNLKDKQQAAEILARVGESLDSLCQSCKGETGEKSEGVSRLLKKFDSSSLTENIPGSSHVAYSVNKGSEVSLCIREKDTDDFHDTNTIHFVAIHELAHIMSVSNGHTDEFWDNMKYLLEKGISSGIYTPVDYAKTPVKYCGMDITSTPLEM
jgi:hypothetical protein